MSAVRATLPDDATPTPSGPAARDAFAQRLSTARQRRDEVAATGGAQAVAQAAYERGGPSVGELAAVYERLAQEARTRRSGTAA